MISPTLRSGVPAFRVTEPECPALFAHVIGTGNSGVLDPEEDTLLVVVFHGPQSPCATTALTGRAGMLAWYARNVGHCPDADAGHALPIISLLDLVVSVLILQTAASE
jgi:hypothetical protein